MGAKVTANVLGTLKKTITTTALDISLLNCYKGWLLIVNSLLYVLTFLFFLG